MSRNVSATARRALYASQTGEAFLVLLEIDHDDLEEPIRVTSDAIDTPHGEAFAATFARTSTAYKSDGSQVASGVPRYEAGQFGQAIMVEEGTTNLFSAPDNLSSASWTKGRASYSAGKLTEDATASNTHYVSQNISVTAGVTYAFSAKVRAAERSVLCINLHNTPFGANSHAFFDVASGLCNAPAGTARILPLADGEFLCQYILTATSTDSASTVYFHLASTYGTAYDLTTYSGDGVSGLYLRQPQAEAKPYSTSFANGTREPEKCVVPIAALNPRSFTVEVSALITDHTKRSGDVGFPRIFTMGAVDSVHGGGLTEIAIYRYDTALDRWRVRLAKNGSVTYLYILDTDTPNGWRRFAFRCDGTTFDVLVDGVVKASTTNLANLPDVFTHIHLGANDGSSTGTRINTLFDNLRISSSARTDAEISAPVGKKLRIDGDTTVYLSFDGSLSSANRYIAFPFAVTLPDDRDDQIARARLTIDNVDRQIVQTIRSLSSAPTVRMKIVLASSPDVVEAGPFEFRLSNVGYDSLTVEGELGYEEDILNMGFPAHTMSPQHFPGLFS